MGLQVHEMLHILLQQEQRRGEREENRWYLASEIAVNDTALKSGFTLPGETDEKLRGMLPDKKTENKSVEEIYDLLPPTLEIEIPIHVICIGEGGGEGSSNQSSDASQNETALQGFPKLISGKDLKLIISKQLLMPRCTVGCLQGFTIRRRSPHAENELAGTAMALRDPGVHHGLYVGIAKQAIRAARNLSARSRQGGNGVVVCIDTSGSVDRRVTNRLVAMPN